MKDVPWMLNHRLNSDGVLPGAAYVVMATTAAQRLFHERPIEMIELKKLSWDMSIIFFEGHAAIEVVLTLSTATKDAKQATTDFYVGFCSDRRDDKLDIAAGGKLIVQF